MNKLNKLLLYALAGSLITFTSCDSDDEAAPVFQSNFEELNFPAEADAYYGQDKAGEKTQLNPTTVRYDSTYESGGALYDLSYTVAEGYSYWGGVAYSKQTNDTLTGPAGGLVAIPGKGANNSEVYAIMYGSDTISFVEDQIAPVSIQLTNNAYAYYSMLEGDTYAKEFGGPEEVNSDPDYFKVIITGVDVYGNATGSVHFYLADYRFEDNSKDYIVDSWKTVDLSSLGEVEKLAFSFASSDVGDWGINTPLYVALDDLKYKLPVLE